MMNRSIAIFWLLIAPLFIYAGDKISADDEKVKSAVEQLNVLIKEHQKNRLEGNSHRNSYIFFLEETEDEVFVRTVKESDYLIINPPLVPNDDFPLGDYDLSYLETELLNFNEPQDEKNNPNNQKVYVLLSSGYSTYSYIPLEGNDTGEMIENLKKGVDEETSDKVKKAVAHLKALQSTHRGLVHAVATSEGLSTGQGFMMALTKYKVHESKGRTVRIMGNTYPYGDYAKNIIADVTSNVPSFFDVYKSLKSVGKALDQSTVGLLEYLKNAEDVNSEDDDNITHLTDDYAAATADARELHMAEDIASMASLIDNAGENFVLFEESEIQLEGESKNRMDALEEKLKLLADKTDHRFYVVIKEVKYVLPGADINKFSQDVFEASSLSGSSNGILITIPLYRTEVIQELPLKLVDFDIPMQGIHASVESVSAGFDPSRAIYDNVIETYKSLSKPHTLYSFYISYKGDVFPVPVQESNSDIKGKDIYELQVFVDSRLSDYKTILFNQKISIQSFEEIDSQIKTYEEPYLNQDSNPPYQEELYSLRQTYLDKIEEYDDKIWDFDKHFPNQQYTPIAHGIREPAIDKEAYPDETHGNVGNHFARWYAGHQFYGFDASIEIVNSPSDEVFVLGKNQVVYEENLLMIDALSLVLIPTGFDIVGDITGTIYTGWHNDWGNVALYGAAAVVPFANAAALRIAIKEFASGTKVLRRGLSNIELVTKSDALYSGVPFRLRKKLPWSMWKKLEQEGASALMTKLKSAKITDAQLLKLGDELKNNAQFLDGLKQNPDLVDAWKVIENNPILRKKPKNLENISKWLDEGIEPQKLTDGIAKSPSKQELIDELGTAQSKLHAQVLIKNYDNIPGVDKGRFVSNSSSLADKTELPSSWSTDFNLDADGISTFTGKIEPLELKQGDKIYRVSDAYRGGGAYWTRTKPGGLEDVVGGTAVRPEWNNFEYMYEYIVPDGVSIKTWKGNAARQRVSEVGSNYHLPGGDEQLFIPFIKDQDLSFVDRVIKTKAQW